MPRPPVSISLSSFGAHAVLEHGQASFLPLVSAGGATFAEVREELFGPGEPDLQALAQAIQTHRLQCIYSSPLQLWQENGQLDTVTLKRALGRAQSLNARWLKVSIGYYVGQNLAELAICLAGYPVRLLVENDQTAQGGRIAPLQDFFAAVQRQQLDIGMTFDIGNWHWQRETPSFAAMQLGRHVEYVHCKAVRQVNERLHAVPPSVEELADWTALFACFRTNLPRAIEFPLQGDNLAKEVAQQVENLANLGQLHEERHHA
ncbi:sugar phosphate isomerase/epimerase family protein [Azomonas macrocytogenes]|uniref:Sugar phosphate isomerase/epimerase n=1 Tax=Azomonas macrocytogenes TaxID=69962 RepID=A0A839T5Z8_AZOMA|nr:TIM barrel protein [Azomonas macrocytogenes]MBB3103365.1 sugar phosphate isomerase/epimerase [Azomonas macrocytogenes]